jgi:hypothetical protein
MKMNELRTVLQLLAPSIFSAESDGGPSSGLCLLGRVETNDSEMPRKDDSPCVRHRDVTSRNPLHPRLVFFYSASANVRKAY